MADGFLVALWLDPETATALAVPGGEPAESLHVTLAYCPDAAELGDLAIARTVAAVEREVGWRAPLTGKVGGYGRFLASDSSDGKDVFYAAPDVPGLAVLRQCVVQAMFDGGCPPSTEHDFTPHVTLAYLDPGAANPVKTVEPLPLTFGAVTIMAGDRRIDIPLFAQLAVFAVRHDEARPGHLTVVQPAAFADPPEWAPFLPVPGQYTHPIYGFLDFSPERYERIVDNFKSGVYQSRLPVNAEHDVVASGAVGWIVDMRIADDGSVEVKPEWNRRGRELIEDDRFPYVSAEWYDVWTDPVSGEAIPDVAVGLALTTHPYFKESVLRPLAASEAVLTRVSAGSTGGAGLPGKESGMAEDQPTITTPPETPADKPPTVDVKALTEQILAELGGESTISSPTVRQFVERAAAELAEARADKARSEAESREMAIQNARLLAENRAKTFTDEVTGKSPENGTVWYGAIPDHVRMLRSLAEKFGTDSWEFRQYRDSNRAAAEAIKAGALFSELGTGRGPDRTQSAYDKLAALARERMAAAEQTFEQAFDAVLNTERELAVAYMREQRP